MAGPVPERVRVQAHVLGFGEGIVLTFGYPRPLDDGRDERHLLIDFGSTHWPRGARRSLRATAESIAQRVGGKLDAIVVTHRHKDHLSGFGDPAAGAIVASLRPEIVLRPWTEEPGLADDASGPGAGGPGAGAGDRSLRFAAGLAQAQEFAGQLAAGLDGARRGLRGMLGSMAAGQVPNAAAIARLDAIAAAAPRGARYLSAGQPSGIDERLLPGVRVSVLGPPTPEQWPIVTGQKADDPQYWIAWRRQAGQLLARVAPDSAAAAAVAEATAVAETAAPTIPPGHVRWLVDRMRAHQGQSLLRIVRALDGALNNTSLILLFEVGRRRLLFPGDAQIENWSWCLDGPDAARLGAGLPEVDFYKVGHHGSRNATPRSLVAKWQGRADPLTSLMSTLPGVHGESVETAVPRATLVAALEQLGPLFRTDELAPGSGFVELTASTSDRRAFTLAV